MEPEIDPRPFRPILDPAPSPTSLRCRSNRDPIAFPTRGTKFLEAAPSNRRPHRGRMISAVQRGTTRSCVPKTHQLVVRGDFSARRRPPPPLCALTLRRARRDGRVPLLCARKLQIRRQLPLRAHRPPLVRRRRPVQFLRVERAATKAERRRRRRAARLAVLRAGERGPEDGQPAPRRHVAGGNPAAGVPRAGARRGRGGCLTRGAPGETRRRGSRAAGGAACRAAGSFCGDDGACQPVSGESAGGRRPVRAGVRRPAANGPATKLHVRRGAGADAVCTTRTTFAECVRAARAAVCRAVAAGARGARGAHPGGGGGAVRRDEFWVPEGAGDAASGEVSVGVA